MIAGQMMAGQMKPEQRPYPDRDRSVSEMILNRVKAASFIYLKLNTILSSGIPIIFVLVLFLFKDKKALPVSQEAKKQNESGQNYLGQNYPERLKDAKTQFTGNLFEQIAMFFRVGPGLFIMAGTAGIKTERHQSASQHNRAKSARYQCHPTMRAQLYLPHLFPDIDTANTRPNQRDSGHYDGKNIQLAILLNRGVIFFCHQLANSLSTSFTQ